MKRVGILGGTFDPVHNGHLAIAEEALTGLRLDRVLFVPAGQPWMKSDRAIAPAEHRVAIVRLAIEGNPHFGLSLIEVERHGPTYTVDTLRELCAQYGTATDLYFIMGWDGLPEFPRWKEPSEIIRLAMLVAVPRPHSPKPDVASLERRVPGISKRVVFLEGPLVDISATDIRERLRKGQTLGGLVPEAVEAYVREKGLYGG